MSRLDRDLAALASLRRGLITLDALYEQGVSRQQVAHRVATDRLLRVERGVYAVDGLPPDLDREMCATVLATRGLVAISHLAAARRLTLPGYRHAPWEVSVERGVRLRRSGIRVHESTDLDRCQIIEVDGLPVTDAGRTLFDLARYVPPKRLARDMEAARRLGLVDRPSLVQTLTRHARRGRPGTRRFREVLAQSYHRTEITDSDFEMLMLALLREHGLPEPVLHHRVYEGDRFVAEVDMAYPERRIALECDGEVHLERDVRERDLLRQNDLMLVGWQVLRFTPQRYWTRPERIVAEVRDAHRTRPVIEPTGDRGSGEG